MSVLATLMSFCYSFIGLGLAIAKATGKSSLPRALAGCRHCQGCNIWSEEPDLSMICRMIPAEHDHGTGTADGLWEDQTAATKTWGIFQASARSRHSLI